MFDQLFADRRTVQRYVAAPLLAQRLRYLHHRAEQGAAPATLRNVAAYQLAVTRTMDLQPSGEVCAEEVHAAAGRWVSRTPPHHARKDATPARAAFASTALGWLRFLGRMQEPRKADAPWAALVAEYAHYMSAERGLAPLTVYTRRKSTQEFLTRFSADGRGLHDLTVFVYRVEAGKSAKWRAASARMGRYAGYGPREWRTRRFEGASARTAFAGRAHRGTPAGERQADRGLGAHDPRPRPVEAPERTPQEAARRRPAGGSTASRPLQEGPAARAPRAPWAPTRRRVRTPGAPPAPAAGR